MVIPGGDDGALLLQLFEAGIIGQLLVFTRQHIHVAGIAVDIIAEENKQLGLERVDWGFG